MTSWRAISRRAMDKIVEARKKSKSSKEEVKSGKLMPIDMC
jgi:hypothetical protein